MDTLSFLSTFLYQSGDVNEQKDAKNKDIFMYVFVICNVKRERERERERERVIGQL